MNARLTAASGFAPWAEIVAGVGPVAVDDLLSWPDDGRRYEVVEGVLVRGAGNGARAATVVRRLAARLGDYVDAYDLGIVTGADGVFKFPHAETGLLPDVGFLAAERADRIADYDKPIPFPPDLAVEVISPSQSAADLAAKVQRYLIGGTALVWVFRPERGAVDVWRPRDLRPRYQDMRAETTLHAGSEDTLDGGDVVPGFSCLLAPLFSMRREGAGL
ncbi:MAG: Uma2 family endonuclease [Chloroflexota bacterium]